MEISWATKLEQEFIHLFNTFEGEETERSYYKKGEVLRGIEVGEGWSNIVEDLLRKLEWIRTHNEYIPNPEYKEGSILNRYIPGPNAIFKIFQIKEKFGIFTCYIKTEGNETQNRQADLAVAFAEGQAILTCENCGALHKNGITGKSWRVCHCNVCIDKK